MYLSSYYTDKTIPVKFKWIFPPPNYQIYSNWIKFSIMAYFESNIYWITGNIPKFLVVAGIFQITDEQNDTLKLIFQVKKIFFDNLETKNIKFYDFQSNGWVKKYFVWLYESRFFDFNVGFCCYKAIWCENLNFTQWYGTAVKCWGFGEY